MNPRFGQRDSVILNSHNKTRSRYTNNPTGTRNRAGPCAAVGENGRTTGKAYAVLLANACGRTPDESAVLGDVARIALLPLPAN